MTEADQSWAPAGYGSASPRRRAALVAGAAVATVVLALVGGISGWMLAGEPDDGLIGAPDTSAASPTRSAPSTKSRGPAPAATRSDPPSKAEPPAGSLMVPDLVGLDFEDARDELRRRNLGWHLVFRGLGSSRAVEGSDPPAGRAVRPGVTVRVLVAGAAPPVEVPDVTGASCSKAADRLVDAGLYPEYPDTRAGEVLQQEPDAGTTLRWNDRVRIHCGKPSSGDESSPSY